MADANGARAENFGKKDPRPASPSPSLSSEISIRGPAFRPARPLRAIIAGSRSGCGKTTAALALMAALTRRGMAVQGCKSGPDFIDPGYHRLITGRPSYNLDSWMAGEDGVLRSLARAWTAPGEADCGGAVLLIEGAMALFDGSGAGAAGSTAHLAELLHIPLILVLDARGIGQSVAALAKGFTELRADLKFAGIVCSHAGGQGHGEIIREALAASPVPLLGVLPRKGAPQLRARHLGLLMAEEARPGGDFAREAAAWFEDNVDVDLLLERVAAQDGGGDWPALARGAAPREAAPPLPGPGRAVGIALDEAFCFMYPDFPDLLREYGAEPRFFSPLRDAAPPPECAALVFPGGYPELHAARLSSNISMREAVRAFGASGRPVYGECGGYMYLMESLEAEGRTHAMSGCLPLGCRFEGRMAALGYREVRAARPGLFGPGSGRGHEYHYSVVSRAAPGLEPLWRVSDRLGRALGPEGACLGSVCGSWVHLFPEGARALWRNFLESAFRAFSGLN